jgi:hypothetical protein
MKIYLAGAGTWYNKELMKIYFAGFKPWYSPNINEYDNIIEEQKPYVLDSFYSIWAKSSKESADRWLTKLLPKFKGFMLDSGAFTFMNAKEQRLKKGKMNWDNYIKEYAEFINKYNIDLFFELDIDSIVGINKVEEYRKVLEKLTNKKSIPVWHRSRGLDCWRKMVKEYDYVAIGGLVTKEIKRSEFDIFNTLLKIAAKNNCKVHGLGFTNLLGLMKYKFYSVDSTSWLYGNKVGFLYQFQYDKMGKIEKEKLQRIKYQNVAYHNFREWLKFSKYAELNL